MLTVSALTRQIADAVADLGTVEVQGELSQVKVAPSGHLYATLKDAGAVLSLVLWRSTVARLPQPLPREGEVVVARGSIEVYPPRGSYQIIATRLARVGAGDLAARFEALKARLAAEGLFDDERKRPLPRFPRAVGLATAAGSAALADLVTGIRTRFPQMPVVVAPCLVQGAGAAPAIVAALERLQAQGDVDVIICGRGGGSLEDLWAFNEEAVVRAIVACRVPVISAVGHETDTVLADFAADPEGGRDGAGTLFITMDHRPGLQGCWECEDFEGCGKLDFLGGVHGDAHLKNLRILSRKGPEAFIAGKRHW